MKTLLVSILLVFAFIVQLQTGERGVIPGAVGFYLEVQDKIPVHVFIDRDGKPIAAIPTNLIQYAVFLPDDKVM